MRDVVQATHNQYKAGAEQRQAELAIAAREARSGLEAAQRVRQEAEERAQRLQEQLEAEQTARKVLDNVMFRGCSCCVIAPCAHALATCHCCVAATAVV